MTSFVAHRLRPAVLLVTAALVAGCGQVGRQPSPTVALTGETTPGCPNFVTVVETSPEPTDYSEGGPIAREQERLAGDRDKALAYIDSHLRDFGSFRFVNGPRVRLVFAFRDHVAEHCADLRALLAYPDEFEIVQSRYTEAALRKIQDEITTLAQGHMYGVGVFGDIVQVSLRADAEAVAAQLVARYGDAIQVTVGRFAYPDRSPAQGTPPCAAPGPDTTMPGIEAAVRFSATSIPAGADFTGTVTVVNRGTAAAHLETGSPLTAVIFASDGQTVVSTYFGAIAGVGLGLDLAPGASQDIDVVGSTASCDASIGYALAPGPYVVRIPVEVYTVRPTGPTEIAYLWSAPANLTVTSGP